MFPQKYLMQYSITMQKYIKIIKDTRFYSFFNDLDTIG